MDKFTSHTGTVMPLRRSDVDTDQIIPAVYLKRVTRTGFEDGLFSAWRDDPAFVLNNPAHASATHRVPGSRAAASSPGRSIDETSTGCPDICPCGVGCASIGAWIPVHCRLLSDPCSP